MSAAWERPSESMVAFLYFRATDRSTCAKSHGLPMVWFRPNRKYSVRIESTEQKASGGRGAPALHQACCMLMLYLVLRVREGTVLDILSGERGVAVVIPVPQGRGCQHVMC